jgi:hypothetical protein
MRLTIAVSSSPPRPPEASRFQYLRLPPWPSGRRSGRHLCYVGIPEQFAGISPVWLRPERSFRGRMTIQDESRRAREKRIPFANSDKGGPGRTFITHSNRFNPSPPVRLLRQAKRSSRSVRNSTRSFSQMDPAHENAFPSVLRLTKRPATQFT